MIDIWCLEQVQCIRNFLLEIIVNNFVTLSVKLCYHEVHVLTSCVYRFVIFHNLIQIANGSF